MKKGFSLIEVLAAVTILAGVLFAVTRIISASYLYAFKVDKIYLGTELARLKLHDIEVKIAKDGLPEAEFKDEGDFEEEAYEGFKWKYSIKRVFIPLPDFTGLGGKAQGKKEESASILSLAKGNIEDFFKERIRKLSLVVYWDKGKKETEKVEFTVFLTTKGSTTQFNQYQRNSTRKPFGRRRNKKEILNFPKRRMPIDQLRKTRK